ncbi:hypothetical protein NMG60_11007666 [Bertholletia excelsa]
MAEQQRIHPQPAPDVEAPPATATVPLFPRGSSKSDRPDLPEAYPPFHRTIPVTHSKPPKRSNFCRKCLCWTVSLLVFQIIVIAITAGIIYLVFRPKLPKYSVDGMRITQFNLTQDSSILYATINLNITARNPNKKIGIYYLGGSDLGIWYDGKELCEGSLPAFYQGHRNTTVMDVELSGQTANASALLTSLQEDQQQRGSIPLRIRAKVPVKIKLGGIKLMKWKFLVRCNLEVNTLSENNDISIQSSSCKFRFRF